MIHAREDYNRIQDLAEVVEFIRQLAADNRDEDPTAASAYDFIASKIEERYGFSKGIEPIPVDEPVFLLRAQDKAAAPAVRCWVAIAQLIGAKPSILVTALNHADILMEDWGEKGIPDMPIGLASF